MNLPKVVIKDNFSDYLNGKEVKATFISQTKEQAWPGEHVIAFKDAISAGTNLTVPKSQQSHYIGIEGTITKVENDATAKNTQYVRIVKV
jgi:archaeosine-15-forming tRNA-guanine transglycosylase